MPSPTGPPQSCKNCGDQFPGSPTGRTVHCPKCRTPEGRAAKLAGPKPAPKLEDYACPTCAGSGREASGKPCAGAKCNKSRGLTGGDFNRLMNEWNTTRGSLSFNDRRARD